MFKITQNSASRKVELKLHDLKDINVRGIRQAFYQIGAIARRTIKDNISVKPRHGRLEKFRGRSRRASVTGESFANKTGAAKKTIGFDVRGAQELEFGFRENQDTKYVEYLEDGTAKMGKRPTLAIASKSTVGKAQVIMEKELQKAHKEGFK